MGLSIDVGTQTAQIGSQTVNTQQTQILLCNGYHNPWPCTQFFNDLLHQINQWQLTRYKILLCLDANEDTMHPHPEHGYGKILNDTGIVDLHCYQHPNITTPATQNCGSLSLNACLLGSNLFIEALIGAWIMLFGFPSSITGNHCILGLNFDANIYFGNKLPQPAETKTT